MCDNKGNMVYCSSCGEKLQEGDLFCFSCGTKVDYAIDSSLKQKSTRFGRVGKLLKSGHCRIIILASIVLSIILLSCHLQKKDGLYMVIDISSGIESSRFPVEYMDDIPDGDWNDEYKTNKIVLRRIEPGEFSMGSPEGETGRELNETQHKVKITKSYYIGVFEITQRQWELVTGGRPSSFCREPYYKKRPVENVSYEMVRGYKLGMEWPNSSAVDADSFIGILRKKTGENGLDLPTEAQWEYACRAGCTNALSGLMDDYDPGRYNTSADPVSDTLEITETQKKSNVIGFVDGVYNSEKGTAEVGKYFPNSSMLYDMVGNVHEMCLDVYSEYDEESATDPVGGANTISPLLRVARGGSWNSTLDECRSASRQMIAPSLESHDVGLRLCCSMEPIISVQSQNAPRHHDISGDDVSSDNEEKEFRTKISKDKSKSLIEILGISPVDQEDGKVEYFSGIFGYKLGEKIGSSNSDDSNSGSLRFTPLNHPMGLTDGFLLVTSASSQLYQIRAVYALKSVSNEVIDEKYEDLKDMLESAIGISMEEMNGGHGCKKMFPSSRNNLSPRNIMFFIKKKNDRIAIDVVDEKLGYQQYAYEKRKNQESNELGFIPNIRPGDDKEIKGVFGYRFGMSLEGEDLESVDDGYVCFKKIHNKLGFSHVMLGARKDKYVYDITGIYSAKNISGAISKFNEIKNHLRKKGFDLVCTGKYEYFNSFTSGRYVGILTVKIIANTEATPSVTVTFMLPK